MKTKGMWITALLTLFIVISGIFTLPMLQSFMFDAPRIVSEQASLSDGLARASSDFMDTLTAPIGAPTRPMSADEIETLRIDSLTNPPRFYENLFKTADLTYSEDVFSTLAATENGSFSILDADTEKNGRPYCISIALDATTPVLFRCINKARPSADEIQNAVVALEQYISQADAPLQAYIEQLDSALKGNQNYDRFITSASQQVFLDKGTEYPSPTLSHCCALGVWQVYWDEDEVALVCMMGQYNLILFYDAIDQCFCGYNLSTNQPIF